MSTNILEISDFHRGQEIAFEPFLSSAAKIAKSFEPLENKLSTEFKRFLGSFVSKAPTKKCTKLELSSMVLDNSRIIIRSVP
jgi:hypothetical protein